jgi:uncharacterized protein HemY
MKVRSVVAVACFAAALPNAATASAAEQCLSAAEAGHVRTMATVMATGSAVRRCGRCLGAEKYEETVAAYENAQLMLDFRRAKTAVDESADPGTLAHVDALVRDNARLFVEALSEDCSACEKTAAAIDTLSDPAARTAFYGSEDRTMEGAKVCP